MNKKIIVIAIVIVLVGIVIWGVSVNGKKPKGEPVVIGALFPLTGGLATYGEPAQKAAELAMNEINENGGVNGRPLSINFQDHQCKPPVAVSAYNQLYSSGVRVFTSVACSGTVLAIAPTLTDSVLLGAIVTSPKITGVSPKVFRNWASDIEEAKLFADEIVKRGYKKLAVIYEETDYAKGLKLSLEQELKGIGVEIISESFASHAPDMRTQIAKLQSQNPDVLFVSPQTVTNGDKVLRTIQELNFRPLGLFINDNVIKSNSLLTSYQGLLEGAIGGDFPVMESENLNDMLANYKATYGEECPQTNICAAVYDNIHILAKALESEDVAGYLKNLNYQGVSGLVSFDDKNDRAGARYSLFLVKNGNTELLK